MNERKMKRISVVGSSCSGKSTFSKDLAQRLSIDYIELDQLHWLPDWVELPDDEFLDLVDKATTKNSWVVDGNYSVTREIIWSKATTVIWLNHSFSFILCRSITRSIKRIVTKEELFSGNIESFKQTFLSRDSIIIWVLKTFHSKRRRYERLFSQQNSHACNLIELRGQKQVDEFFKNIV